jgi:hypothetical protein
MENRESVSDLRRRGPLAVMEVLGLESGSEPPNLRLLLSWSESKQAIWRRRRLTTEESMPPTPGVEPLDPVQKKVRNLNKKAHAN